MCRLLAYLGPEIAAADLLTAPEHSLVVQSYAPREMTAGILNADGFGMAWFDQRRRTTPFVYRTILPVWNDANIADLAAYVRTGCMLAYVRSATPGQSLDLSNCQPFTQDRLAGIHNGFVADFRTRLRRQLRGRLSEALEDGINGTTDSEHLFAWLVHHLPDATDLASALEASLLALGNLAPGVEMSLNQLVSDGDRLVASRMAYGTEAPSLYWLRDHRRFPNAVVMASEPLFEDAAWRSVPEASILTVGVDLDVRITPIGT